MSMKNPIFPKNRISMETFCYRILGNPPFFNGTVGFHFVSTHPTFYLLITDN